MNIVFACDRGYLQHLAVAMVSLFDHCPAGSLNVYVINTDIDRNSWSVLDRINRKFSHNLVDAKIEDACLEGVPVSYGYSKTSYHKLFIPDVIPNDKALYLDSDLVVVDAIGELYNTNIDEVYLAAVENPGFSRHRHLGMDPESKYFNMGVMLVNVRKWREDAITNQVIDFSTMHPEAIVLVEQCAANAVINGRWRPLPLKFNLQTYYFEALRRGESPARDIQEAMKEPVVIHFTASPKPWTFMSRDRYKYLYWKYLMKTPYRFYIPGDLTLKNVARRILPEWIKTRLRRGAPPAF